MAFCANCGKKMGDKAKFCPSCGAPAGEAAPAPKPVTEKVGNIRKCPACGAEAPSMTSICPSCGHEFTDVKLSDEIRNFTKELERIDSANMDINMMRGSIIPFIVAAGLFFFGIICLSLAVGAMGSGFRYHRVSITGYSMITVLAFGLGLVTIIAPRPRMSPEEKQKRAFVENAVITNTKEVIIEFFNFAIFQIEDVNSFLALILPNQKYTQLWNNVWKSKCKQVFNKAKFSMAGDPQGLKAMKDILTSAGIKL
jgi:RNA polymerase subunit RPABC4/transcription elongation factor Spt4